MSLCAGALFVLEAAGSCGKPVELESLARTMIRRGSQSIVSLARQFDLDASLVRLIVMKNDMLEENVRVVGMLDFLRGLCGRPAEV